MAEFIPPAAMVLEHEFEFRVRYSETDAQGRVYHANYIAYFEMGRTELCRASGLAYKEMEAAGIFFVVTEVSCKYRQGAMYDDLLKLRTRVTRTWGARITHEYQLFRDGRVIVEGQSTIALIDRDGQVKRLPDWLLLPESESKGESEA